VVVPAASSSIGLGLKEVAYKDFFRIVVNSVKESAEVRYNNQVFYRIIELSFVNNKLKQLR
jgi:hypothetical protein